MKAVIKTFARLVPGDSDLQEALGGAYMRSDEVIHVVTQLEEQRDRLIQELNEANAKLGGSDGVSSEAMKALQGERDAILQDYQDSQDRLQEARDDLDERTDQFNKFADDITSKALRAIHENHRLLELLNLQTRSVQVLMDGVNEDAARAEAEAQQQLKEREEEMKRGIQEALEHAFGNRRATNA